MPSPKAKLGDLLVSAGLITPEQLERALDIQRKAHGESLGAVLLSQEAITEGS